MIKIGDFNNLKVLRFARGTCLLQGEDQDIPLPAHEAPKGTRPGDILKVFVYNESKDRLGASRREPLAKVGEFAVLQVKDVTNFGAFLGWGISKDLFVPRKYFPKGKAHERPQAPRTGDLLPVFLTLDYEQRGVIGTCRIEDHFNRDTESLAPNQEVSLLVFELTKLGARVIIDNQWEGLLYRNEIFERISTGTRHKGYIKKVREDGLVDAALQPQGFPASSRRARDTILHALERQGGYLPLHDKSSPEEIRRALQMSKKLFKSTIGNLYKEGLITIEQEGIRKR